MCVVAVVKFCDNSREILLREHFGLMTIWIPNLNFEDELSGKSSKINLRTQSAIDDLAPLMGLMAEAGDAVLVHVDAIPEGVPECLNHVRFQTRSQPMSQTVLRSVLVNPWGWSQDAAGIAAGFGMSADSIPNVEAVTHVNSRQFSSNFDAVITDSPQLLPFGDEHFGRMCDTMDACHTAVAQMIAVGFQRWVAKPQVSNAGRNRLLVTGSDLNDQQCGWLAKQLDKGGVYLEPWTQPTAEHGLQFHVRRLQPALSVYAAGSANETGTELIEFIGATRLVNDDVGRYQGSLIGSDNVLQAECAESIKYGFRVCAAAQSAGYFGPIGIDSYRFRDASGKTAIRLCNDVNSRFTMGRLALHLRPLLREKKYGLWCQVSISPHFNRSKTNNSASLQEVISTMQKLLTMRGENDVFIERISPVSVGGRPVQTSTVLLTGKSPEQLLNCNTAFRRQTQSSAIRG